jgi:hypothetical protein
VKMNMAVEEILAKLDELINEVKKLVAAHEQRKTKRKTRCFVCGKHFLDHDMKDGKCSGCWENLRDLCIHWENQRKQDEIIRKIRRGIFVDSEEMKNEG